jgi:predicted O-methyltransferase YrrM
MSVTTKPREQEIEEEHAFAFADLQSQTSIGIEGKEDFDFTRNWFRNRNQSTWSTFFRQKFGEWNPVKMLQIGVFEGMDLVWCMQHILQNRSSRVLAVDPWEATRKIDAVSMSQVQQRARLNLSKFPNKATLIRDYSQNLLRTGKQEMLVKSTFDLAIIDGDHRAEAVYEDACLVLPYMKKGGWMVFDDVRNRVRKKDHVQQGLDRFRRLNSGATQLAWRHRYCDCLEVL